MEQKRNFKISLVKEIRENITGYKIRIGAIKKEKERDKSYLVYNQVNVKEPQHTNIQNAEG